MGFYGVKNSIRFKVAKRDFWNVHKCITWNDVGFKDRIMFDDYLTSVFGLFGNHFRCEILRFLK